MLKILKSESHVTIHATSRLIHQRVIRSAILKIPPLAWLDERKRKAKLQSFLGYQLFPGYSWYCWRLISLSSFPLSAGFKTLLLQFTQPLTTGRAF